MYRDTLACRCNNPFNIRANCVRWKGRVGSECGFVKFLTVDYGLRAGVVLLRNYIRKGFDTISSIIKRYAPESENNTSAYIAYVCGVFRSAGLNPFERIVYRSIGFQLLCAAICSYECGYDFTPASYSRIFKCFDI